MKYRNKRLGWGGSKVSDPVEENAANKVNLEVDSSFKQSFKAKIHTCPRSSTDSTLTCRQFQARTKSHIPTLNPLQNSQRANQMVSHSETPNKVRVCLLHVVPDTMQISLLLAFTLSPSLFSHRDQLRLCPNLPPALPPKRSYCKILAATIFRAFELLIP